MDFRCESTAKHHQMPDPHVDCMRLAQAMDLKVGETQDIIMWAFPKTLETIQDILLGRVVSNPTPVEFPVSCVGAKPQVEVRLDMPPSATPPAASADAVAAAAVPAPEPAKAAEVKPAAAAKGGAKKGKEPAAPELPLTPRSKVCLPPLENYLWHY